MSRLVLLNGMRRKSVFVLEVGIVLEDLGLHDTLDVLEQSCPDCIRINAPCIVPVNLELSDLDMVVILNAGYEGDLGCIFVGKISRAVSKKPRPP